ncbi:MAG TPA: UDP-N-acetylmuramoyl-L-alanyl-D-glutamate--2,6-diaminopimelate ligase [Gammaproteobacteria bacterium]|nr:UDP-N-acetylmuramoyl-L-alanyl-D-glutamate--2,6-diaminopimelate ligase [Gammaproteobacteria bacterium]
MTPLLHDPTRAVPLAELLAGLRVAGVLAGDLRVTGMTEDSRQVMPGDLFLALPGIAGDHTVQHSTAALAAGAGAVLTDSEASAASLPGVLHCAQLRCHASSIASRYCDHPSHALEIVGVTGTNGKSTVTHLVATALAGLTQTHRVGLLGTLGNGLLGALEPSTLTTVSAVAVQGWLAALRAAGARHVVTEVSSHALDQHRVQGVRFAVAAFTNLTRDHLDYHGSLAAYAEAKLGLFDLPEVAACCYNAADPLAQKIRERVSSRMPSIGWALDAVASATLRPTYLQMDRDGIRMRGLWQQEGWEIVSPLVGRFNAENLLAALGCLLLLGHGAADAAAALARVPSVRGRLERLASSKHAEGTESGAMPLVIVDYAHSPDALEKALLALRPLCSGRLVCVFGCGGERDAGKRPLMGAIAERLADQVIVTSDNPRGEAPEQIIDAILAGISARDAVLIEPDRAQAIALAVNAAAAGDLVLIAGKGHEDYQEIGGRRLPFSDQTCARLAMEARGPC